MKIFVFCIICNTNWHIILFIMLSLCLVIINVVTKSVIWEGRSARMRLWYSGLPFVKSLGLGVVLETSVLDHELHALKEGSGDGGRLFAQQDVDGFGRRHAELAAATEVVGAALGVFAVHQTIYTYSVDNRNLG